MSKSSPVWRGITVGIAGTSTLGVLVTLGAATASPAAAADTASWIGALDIAALNKVIAAS